MDTQLQLMKHKEGAKNTTRFTWYAVAGMWAIWAQGKSSAMCLHPLIGVMRNLSFFSLLLIFLICAYIHRQREISYSSLFLFFISLITSYIVFIKICFLTPKESVIQRTEISQNSKTGSMKIEYDSWQKYMFKCLMAVHIQNLICMERFKQSRN